MVSEPKGAKNSKHPSPEESFTMEAEMRKPPSAVGRAPENPARLLRDTKSTVAALGLLEKAIKFIYQKDFKKARLELKTLLDSHPEEAEILARARSYIRICDREDTAHKRPMITNDQLYTLGVMMHNRGDFEAAISYFRQSLDKHKDADYVLYSLAASLAMKGDLADATVNLRKAIELNEENRVYAKNDSDFLSIYAYREFADLVGLTIGPAAES
jgi:tetratricopeptide (TPR) repeat protein